MAQRSSDTSRQSSQLRRCLIGGEGAILTAVIAHMTGHYAFNVPDLVVRRVAFVAAITLKHI